MRRIALVVTGDRHATPVNWQTAIYNALAPFRDSYDHVVLLHGDGHGPNGAAGIDRIAARMATSLGFQVIPVPAQWEILGNYAGPRRNREMLRIAETLYRHGYEARVLGFHDRVAESKGTKDCLRQAVEMVRIPAQLVTSEGTVIHVTPAHVAAWPR